MKRINLFFILLAITTIVLVSCEEESNTPPVPIEVEFNVTDASSYNAKDGSITVEVVAGDPPYIYTWNTGDTTASITGLGAGEYAVKIVYGENGEAFHEETAVVGQPEPEDLTLDFTVTDVQNYGRASGRIEISVTGGVPPYTYLWSNGSTESIADGLFAGTYSVTVTDSGDPYSITTEGFATVEQPEFVCGTDSIMDVDGILYSTVQIGEYCFLGENLRTIHTPESTAELMIPIEGRLCRGLFCEQVQGAHYTWHAAINGSEPAQSPEDKIQGICPTGWYLPTKEVYEDLDEWLSVDGQGGEGFFSGAKMKGEESSSGFDALFTGNWGFGIYNNAPYASFWTSSQSTTSEQQARMIYLTEDTPFMNAANQPKEFGMNVRCVKDEDLP